MALITIDNWQADKDWVAEAQPKSYDELKAVGIDEDDEKAVDAFFKVFFTRNPMQVKKETIMVDIELIKSVKPLNTDDVPFLASVLPKEWKTVIVYRDELKDEGILCQARVIESVAEINVMIEKAKG